MVHWRLRARGPRQDPFRHLADVGDGCGHKRASQPSLVATHLPWVKQIRPLIRHMDLTPALALLPSQGYIADFLTPPPSTPLASFADELELVRSTPTEQVLHDIEMLVEMRQRPGDARAVPLRPARARSSGLPTCFRSSGSARSSRTGPACARCSRRTCCIARAGSPRAASSSSSQTSTPASSGRTAMLDADRERVRHGRLAPRPRPPPRAVGLLVRPGPGR